MTWTLAINYIGAAFAAGAMIMTRMIPLRVMVICSNIAFIVYGVLSAEYPLALLHSFLLPVNLWRLHQMRRMIKEVIRSAAGRMESSWLTTFMRRKRIEAGDILFRRGDVAEEMYYVVSGLFRVPELGLDLRPGDMFGELALLAPERRRSQSVQCLEAGDLLTVGYDEVNELFFQNPEFGYRFLKLITSRLFADRVRLEEALAVRNRADQKGA